MSIPLTWALPVLIVLHGALVQAQNPDADQERGHPIPPPHHARVSVERLLNGRALPTSFEELQSTLEPGHEVVVVDDAGRKTRGRVSSVSRDTIVIYGRAGSRFRLFRPAEERSFFVNTVTRVEIVDSSRNGILIGAAVAAALVYGIHRWEDATVPDSNSMKGMATIALGGISAALAIGFGEKIDLSMNQAIYERRGRAPTLTLAPWVEPHVKGVRAQFRF